MLNIEKLRNTLNKEAEKNIDNLSCENMLKISQKLDEIIIYYIDK